MFKGCMDTSRSDMEEEREFIIEQVISMALEKYNKLLTSGRWYKKDNKYDQILALVQVSQKLAYDSNK